MNMHVAFGISCGFLVACAFFAPSWFLCWVVGYFFLLTFME